MAIPDDSYRVGRVLSSAWTIWVRMLPRLLALTAICHLPAVPVLLGFVSSQSDADAMIRAGDYGDYYGFMADYLLLINSVSLLVTVLVTCAVVACVNDELRCQRARLVASVGRAIHRLPAVLAACVVPSLLVALPLVLVIRSMFVETNDLALDGSQGADAGATALEWVMSVSFAGRALMFVTSLVIVLPGTVELMEARRAWPLPALRRGRRLLRGVRLRVAGTILVVAVLENAVGWLAALAVNGIADESWAVTASFRYVFNVVIGSGRGVVAVAIWNALREAQHGPDAGDLSQTFA